MDFIKELISQNKHWDSGKMEFPRAEALVARGVFSVLENAAQTKFVVILRGLRRTGKSVLARQLMQKQLEKGGVNEVGWFEFDRGMNASADDLASVIRFFMNRGCKRIVLDEVMFVRFWQDVVKRFYDQSNVKFIVAGSSALELDKRSAESLAGRFQLIMVHPFSFREFLALKHPGELPQTLRGQVLAEDNLARLADQFVRVGGLPEAIELPNDARKNYVRKALLDPLFFKDLPVVFPRANPDLLGKVLELSSATLGSVFQFQSIAQALGCSHPTIATQVEILERGLLIKVLYNYTSSLIKQKRTAKKIIIADNSIVSALNPDCSIGLLAENLVGQALENAFFWRDTQGREVDFILPKKKLAVEVKYQESITSSDEKNLHYFLEKRKGWNGILITKKDESSNGKIKRIPLWKWLLENQA